MLKAAHRIKVDGFSPMLLPTANVGKNIAYDSGQVNVQYCRATVAKIKKTPRQQHISMAALRALDKTKKNVSLSLTAHIFGGNIHAVQWDASNGKKPSALRSEFLPLCKFYGAFPEDAC